MAMIDVGQNDAPQEIIPEDTMNLPVEFHFIGHSNWYPQNIQRRELSALLNWKSNDFPEYDGLRVKELCAVLMNGPECDMRYIYSFATRTWRLE